MHGLIFLCTHSSCPEAVPTAVLLRWETRGRFARSGERAVDLEVAKSSGRFRAKVAVKSGGRTQRSRLRVSLSRSSASESNVDCDLSCSTSRSKHRGVTSDLSCSTSRQRHERSHVSSRSKHRHQGRTCLTMVNSSCVSKSQLLMCVNSSCVSKRAAVINAYVHIRVTYVEDAGVA